MLQNIKLKTLGFEYFDMEVLLLQESMQEHFVNLLLFFDYNDQYLGFKQPHIITDKRLFHVSVPKITMESQTVFCSIWVFGKEDLFLKLYHLVLEFL